MKEDKKDVRNANKGVCPKCSGGLYGVGIDARCSNCGWTKGQRSLSE